jgi:DNA-binding GntR family transcriptional regulator
MSRAGFSTSERIYVAVKQDLLDGRYRPGERIDAALLAEHHGGSITPIRSALYRLVGERLVETRPTEGFYRRALTEASLRALYVWNGQILMLALRFWPHDHHRADTAAPDARMDLARRTADIFLQFGRRSGNPHCASTIAALNDQLHIIRRLEPEVLTETDGELEAIVTSASQPELGELRRATARYHLRRIRAAADLVRLAHNHQRS